MTSLAFIGDVHGQYKEYIDIAQNYTHSICVGDVGFRYDKLKVLDTNFHKIVGGNHDNWETNETKTDYHEKYFLQTKNFLGDYGVHQVPEYGDFFFVRGAWSIDRKLRVFGMDWWENEELDRETGQKAFDLYKETKPEYIITHECPFEVMKHLDLNPEFALDFGYKDSLIRTKTNQLLQMFWEIFSPKIWIFGHFHKSFCEKINGTKFICLAELETLGFQTSKEFEAFVDK